MTRRTQLGIYVFLSAVDFAATVFLVTNGYADEANPFINRFAVYFPSFALGLAVYKTALIACLVTLLKTVHKQNPKASQGLLVFANVLMLGLSGWHVACLRMAHVI